ncbi:MAG TPA: hypothetical protein VGR28_03325 [Candidatus Thermoplasmatota archaeon]|jgi:hypothetical protein|nr:hypothetical protein [Candidatus Thermoplasmatota archaeon]
MASSLAEEVRARHAWILEAGFRITEARDEASFGDSYAVLEGHGVRVRVVRDRGQCWAEIASSAAPEAWTPFDDVCAVLFGARAPTALTMDAAMEQLRERLLAAAPRAREDWTAVQARAAEVARTRRRGARRR